MTSSPCPQPLDTMTLSWSPGPLVRLDAASRKWYQGNAAAPGGTTFHSRTMGAARCSNGKTAAARLRTTRRPSARPATPSRNALTHEERAALWLPGPGPPGSARLDVDDIQRSRRSEGTATVALPRRVAEWDRLDAKWRALDQVRKRLVGARSAEEHIEAAERCAGRRARRDTPCSS